MGELVLVGAVKRGRPPQDTYDSDIAEQICEKLANGLSLSVICANEEMPSRTRVYKWLRDHEDFAINYARARAKQADTFADQIQDIADCLFIPVEHKKTMIDARKWRAARQNWRAWGDKVTHEHDHSIHVAAGEAQLPPGLEFLSRRLSKGQGGPESGDSGVGEG